MQHQMLSGDFLDKCRAFKQNSMQRFDRILRVFWMKFPIKGLGKTLTTTVCFAFSSHEEMKEVILLCAIWDQWEQEAGL
jgi:hypothetical protein